MIKTLTLTNYRQHESAHFVFEEGFVVLRGPNERGKSNLLQAMLYLWFGKSALDHPISEVVTTGRDPKELRVEGTFDIHGVSYSGYRAESGAEIRCEDRVITGQRACTEFMQTLLGGKVDVVKKLMFAQQNAIRGILDNEAEAGRLIEDLANLAIIDQLIDKVKAQHPTGHTKSLELTLHNLKEELPELRDKPSDPRIENLEEQVTETSAKLEALKTEVAKAAEKASEANKVIERDSAAIADFNQYLSRVREYSSVSPAADCAYTQADYEKALLIEKDKALAAQVETARGWKPKMTERTWTGTVATLEEAIVKIQEDLRKTSESIQDLKLKKATLAATKINEGVCGFCKMDISERPEVVETNLKVDKELLALDTCVARLESDKIAASSDLATMQEILKVHNQNIRSVNSQFWEMVVGTVPCGFNWTGPEVGIIQGHSVHSSTILQAIQSHAQAVTLYESAQRKLSQLVKPEAPHTETEVAQAKSDLQRYEDLKLSQTKLESELAALKSELSTRKAVLESEIRSYEREVSERDRKLAAIAKQEQLITDTLFNNQLVKDMTAARGEIRKRVWNMVTATVSTYFSRIRGKPTTITKSDAGFLENGIPASGLSGSGKDMLGLSIRAALLKVFLPALPLMIVDEPFAGCDETREVSGIGVLASMGFNQTILVTHSELADPMADQLIQL